ncbi:MAG TPA: DUF167 family protein [Azospirillaceae bacterium]|nr:DUF167 family protein [Azospirillaceae bacterium]HYE48239.1 DUF167 family protein [Azospirillaceae bacterium]
MAARPPVEAAEGGVRVALRVTPRASRAAVTGLMELPDGRTAVKVAVTVVPEGGKANAAVVELLAKQWRVPKSSIAVVAGSTDRSKIVHVTGDTAALLPLIAAWAQALPAR